MPSHSFAATSLVSDKSSCLNALQAECIPYRAAPLLVSHSSTDQFFKARSGACEYRVDTSLSSSRQREKERERKKERERQRKGEDSILDDYGRAFHDSLADVEQFRLVGIAARIARALNARRFGDENVRFDYRDNKVRLRRKLGLSSPSIRSGDRLNPAGYVLGAGKSINRVCVT